MSLDDFAISAADAKQTTDVTQQGPILGGQHSAPGQISAASKASISHVVACFENDVRGIRSPSCLASNAAACSDPAAESAKLEQYDLEAAAQDQIVFSKMPHSKLMRALDMHLSKPLQLSDSLLAACKLPLELKQADALCAAIQEHTAPAVALLAGIDQLAGYLKSRPTMKLVDATSSQLIALLDQLRIWICRQPPRLPMPCTPCLMTIATICCWACPSWQPTECA